MKYLYIVLLAILSGCIFDSGSKHITGEYKIQWIDTECSRTITFGPIGQMGGYVYEIGWNNKYIIAKRHPNCNDSITDYFIIDIELNSLPKGCYDCRNGVIGPLTKTEFKQKAKVLGILSKIEFTEKYN